MNYVFVLGVGRSGTTWLGDVLGQVDKNLKYIDEPFPKVKKKVLQNFSDLNATCPWFIPFNVNHNQVIQLHKFYEEIASSNSHIRNKYVSHALKRDDESADTLLVKDVHNLAAYIQFLDTLRTKVVVIARDTKRIVDSHFYTFGVNNPYFLDEYTSIKKYKKEKKSTGNIYIDKAIDLLPEEAYRYIKKIKFRDDLKINKFIAAEVLKSALRIWGEERKYVLLLTHEELCRNPLQKFSEAYQHCGFEMNEKIRSAIEKKSTGNKKGTFDTSKNSLEVLSQPYRVLDDKFLYKVEKLGF